MTEKKTRRKKSTDVLIQGAWMKFPKLLLTPKYDKLDDRAKFLYMILADKWSLSSSNGGAWVDADDNIYFVYSRADLSKLTGLSEKTVTKYKKELIKFELLEEELTGRTNRMYLLDFEYDDEDIDALKDTPEISDNDLTQPNRSTNGTFSRPGSDGETDGESREVEITPTRKVKITSLVETPLNQPFDQRGKNYLSGDTGKNYLSDRESLPTNKNYLLSPRVSETKRDSKESMANANPDLDTYLLDNFVEDSLNSRGNILNQNVLLAIKMFSPTYDIAMDYKDIIYKAKRNIEKKSNSQLIFEFDDINQPQLASTVRKCLSAIYKGARKDAVQDPNAFFFRAVANDFEEMVAEKLQREWEK